MSRSQLRNLCCTALGQATAFNMISDDPKKITTEEIKAIKDTGKLLVESINNMLKLISNDEMKLTPAEIIKKHKNKRSNDRWMDGDQASQR